MTYEELLKEADSLGIVVKEKPLYSGDGRILKNKIAIRRDIPTQVKKACILAEELGHYYTTYGDILDQSDTGNRKQELRARKWAYDRQVGLIGIIRCYEHGCQSIAEMADYLEVTEEFLHEALSHYKKKYGLSTNIDRYIIYFEPALLVGKID